MPSTTFRIDVFASSGYGPGGAGEAEDYLGSLDVTTDSQGQAFFDVPFTPPVGLPVVTATATDPQGNTSEVSAQRRATPQTPPPSLRIVPDKPLVFSAPPGDGFSIQDPDAGPLNPVWNLTLSVSAGTLALSSTAGLTGTGDGTGSLSYSGPLSAVDTALTGMTYSPTASPHVFANLQLAAQSDGAPALQTQFLITDGVFVVNTTGDSGPGSLRQAILDSNAATGASNTIDFAIPGSGVQTITPASPLPSLTTPTIIDGTSQPGYAGVPLIAIAPPITGSSDSLTIAGSNVTLEEDATSALGLGDVDRQSAIVNPSGPINVGPGGEIVQYHIDTTTQGSFTAQLQSQGLTARLALLDSQGDLLVRSDGVSPGDRNSQIDENLSPGTYTLTVELTAGAGTYILTSTLAPASAPFQPIPGDYPDGIVAGDFNDDGQTDLAFANEQSDTVAVLLGNGDGTFQPPVTYPAGQLPVGLVAGDFSGDGHLDLAVVNSNAYGNGPDSVSVLLGNGDGTFQPQVTYPVGNDPDAIVAGDFTGDGHLDLAVTNFHDDTVSVLLGNGDGTFQPQVTYAVGGAPDAIAAGDFRGNGRINLAVANYGDNTVSVLMSNGDGTFQPQVTYAVGSLPDTIVAGDFTGDGRTDLAVANARDATVSVLLGNGDGTFQPPVTYAVGLGYNEIVAGDFTGSGHLDLAVAGYGGGRTLGSSWATATARFNPRNQ